MPGERHTHTPSRVLLVVFKPLISECYQKLMTLACANCHRRQGDVATALSDVSSWTTPKEPAGTARQTPLLQRLQAVNGELLVDPSPYSPGRHHHFSRRLTARRARVGTRLPTARLGARMAGGMPPLTAFASVLMIILLTWVQSRRHDVTESAGRGSAMAGRHDLGAGR